MSALAGKCLNSLITGQKRQGKNLFAINSPCMTLLKLVSMHWKIHQETGLDRASDILRTKQIILQHLLRFLVDEDIPKEFYKLQERNILNIS